MKIDLQQFQQLYMQESAEHVAAIEEGLFALRSAPSDLGLLNAIFRSAHSIKGGAGSFGLDNLVRFTHVLESLLDELRNGNLVASAAVIDTLLESVDVLRDLLALPASAPMPAGAQAVRDRLQSFLETNGTAASSTGSHGARAEVGVAASVPQPSHYRILFRPDRSLFDSGCNPLLLVRNLCLLGEVERCDLSTEHLPELASMDPATCYLEWTVEMRTSASEADLREVFEFVEHLAQIEVTSLSHTEADASAQTVPAPAQDSSTAAPSLTAAPLPAPQIATPSAALSGEASPAATPAAARRSSATAESSIRVPIDKVDRLVDLVGEIVIAQSMAAQSFENFTPAMLPRMRETAAALERSVRELHESVMSIRMLPIGTLFQRYTRTVYDIAKSTGKQVRLSVSGSETEIDKGMLELLADPMIHLVRNAVDHGIESPEDRRAAGKPEEGTIALRACHRGGKIVLHIEDDGAGIDPERVRRKAIERGLISDSAELSPAQLRMLIFEPGFSTRDEVSELSGRGVGMDVVRRNIQQMNGSVSLDSTVGQGSCITVELPLTLAILDGLIVRAEDRRMVLPLLSVLETVPCTEDDLLGIVGAGEVLVLRGESVPVLRLHRYFHIPRSPQPTQRSLVVVIEADGRKLGLFLDEVLGQQQVVLKSLEAHLHRVTGLMGATILGDGTVAPILDVVALVEREPAVLPPSTLRMPPPVEHRC